MFDGFEDGASTFCFADFDPCRQRNNPLTARYDRHKSFIYQLANGEASEEDRLLMIDELFKTGRLGADQILDALGEHLV